MTAPDDFSNLSTATEQQVRNEYSNYLLWDDFWNTAHDDFEKRNAWYVALVTRATELNISLLDRAIMRPENKAKARSNAYMHRSEVQAQALTKPPLITRVTDPLYLQWKRQWLDYQAPHDDWPNGGEHAHTARCDFQAECMARGFLGAHLGYDDDGRVGQPWLIKGTNIVVCDECILNLEREEPYALALLLMIQNDKRSVPQSSRTAPQPD